MTETSLNAETTLASPVTSALLPPQRGSEAHGISVAPAWQRRLVRKLLLLDFALALSAALIALLLRFGAEGTAEYKALTLLFPLTFLVMIAAARGYEPRFLGSGSEEYRRVANAGIAYLALVATLAYGMQYELARGYVVVAFPLAIVLVLIGRYVSRQQLHRARRAGRDAHRVLVIGRERSAAELVRAIAAEPYAGFQVVGACIDGSAAAEIEDVPVLGTASSDVPLALRTCQADTIAVAAWSPLSQQDLRRLSWQLEGTGVAIVVAPSVADVAGPRIHIRPVAGLPLLHVEQPEFRGARRIVKATFDRLVALAALMALAPLLIAIGVAIRTTSEGPAIFKQVRVGRDGSTFRIWKFRSMHVNAERELQKLASLNEAADGLLFKIRKDPRVTPLGEHLRRLSLDELPQLVNVLRGDMSLVGPRPPLPHEVEQYGAHLQRRLLVKPGITGLWQVSGRSDLSWEESVRLDLHYVENWSLALDLMIIWKTIFTVLRRQGAY